MDTLLARFNERAALLNDYASLRGVETVEEYAAFMEGVFTDIYALEREMKDLRLYMRQQKETIARLLEQRPALEQQQEQLSVMLNNLPRHLPGKLSSQVAAPVVAPVQPAVLAKAASVPVAAPTANPMRRTSSRPEAGAVLKSRSVATASLSANASVATYGIRGKPSIPFITADEFNSVPTYIRGRLTQTKVNEAIEALNSVFEEKYALLAIPSSKLKEAQRRRILEFRAAETDACAGYLFVTEVDVKESKQVTFKMDSSGKNIVTILRHCGRVKEVRGGGLTRLAIPAL